MRREHRSPLRQRDHRDRARQAARGQARAFDRIDCDVDLGLEAVADLLAEVEHRRLVLLTFADHDGAAHVDVGERRADRLDGACIRRYLVAAPLQRGGRQRPGFGHTQQLQREVAVDAALDFGHV